jgi:hypothetical protein
MAKHVVSAIGKRKFNQRTSCTTAIGIHRVRITTTRSATSCACACLLNLLDKTRRWPTLLHEHPEPHMIAKRSPVASYRPNTQHMINIARQCRHVVRSTYSNVVFFSILVTTSSKPFSSATTRSSSTQYTYCSVAGLSNGALLLIPINKVSLTTERRECGALETYVMYEHCHSRVSISTRHFSTLLLYHRETYTADRRRWTNDTRSKLFQQVRWCVERCLQFTLALIQATATTL